MLWKILDNSFILYVLGMIVGMFIIPIPNSIDQQRISRRTQNCQVQGEEYGCMQSSAWYISGECSCVFSNGLRGEYPLRREE